MALLDVFKKAGSKILGNIGKTAQQFSVKGQLQKLGQERLQSLDPTNPQNIAEAQSRVFEGIDPTGGLGGTTKILPKVGKGISSIFKRTAPKTAPKASFPKKGPQSVPPKQSFPPTQSFPKAVTSTASRVGSSIRAAIKSPAGRVGIPAATALGVGSQINPTQTPLNTPTVPQTTPSRTGTLPRTVEDRGITGPRFTGQRPKEPAFTPVIDPITGQLVFTEGGFAEAGGAGGAFSAPTIPGFGGQFGGGGSEFTGLLNSVGGLGTPANVLDDEEKERSGIRDVSTTGLIPGALGRISAVADAARSQQPPLDVPSAQQVTDIGQVQRDTTSTQGVLGTSAAVADDDFADTINTISSSVDQRIQEQNISDPIPQEPVRETLEQAQQIDLIQDPQERLSTQQFMDQARRDVGLPGLEADRIQIQRQIDAITETYQEVIDDIRANPDLPKGLAQRRLAQLGEQQNRLLQGLVNALDVIDEEIENANDLVNQQFQILRFEEDRMQQQRDNNFRNLNLFISSGAIGGMSDVDIQQWSDATGVPQSILESARESANAVDPEEALKLEKLQNDIELQRQKIADGGDGVGPVSQETQSIADAILSGTIDIKDITPTQRAAVAPILQSEGYTATIANLDRQSITTITDGLQDVLRLWKKVSPSRKGLIQGGIQKFTGGKQRNADVQAFEAAKSVVGQQLTRLFEKGRLSDQDRTFYQSLMPNLLQNDFEVAKAGADELTNRLEAQLTNNLNQINTGIVEPTQADIDYITTLGL